ncbi:uroporphyrinogen-III C-methyltransferase [Pseudorhodobacter turbinis]|uniref:uroporphyrinogen-III C-methyltransferase n=1 Tax=Pseudorhodobacter turbinis TaxID=2500533 RepID=A0A4P8EHQ7_9RHOB|nr:uroporphyrinogen-III C-methyltransferase [Pseudorhodobacter turbinis]QCO56312.1 uroporphyrinogen-III C-methyltransferase [Pseudorhodobacter turbinis]
MKDASPTQSHGQVFLIGAGPGDPELLTVKALRLIRSADVVVFDRLVSPEIMALIPQGTKLIDVGKMPKCHKMAQGDINALLVSLARQGQTVARLKGGDPLIFGRGSEEAEELYAAGVAVEYVPGITAAQGAASSTGVPLTHRGLATGVRYVTGHRAKDALLDLDWASLASAETTLVVYMGASNIAEISMRLQAEGMAPDIPVMAIASATTPREERVIGTLADIAGQVEAMMLEAPVLFIIGQVVSLYDGIAIARAMACEGPGMAAYA